jgi:hypothetical protein
VSVPKVKVSRPQAGARLVAGSLALESDEPDEEQIWNRRGYVIGTAGWIRTTDLLIHSQQQAIDFPTVGSKPNFALL